MSLTWNIVVVSVLAVMYILGLLHLILRFKQYKQMSAGNRKWLFFIIILGGITIIWLAIDIVNK